MIIKDRLKMNSNKEYNRQRASNVLKSKGISWESLNNDTHWKIGKINFFPTTGLWVSDTIGGARGRDIDSLIDFLKNTAQPIEKVLIKKLSVQEIAKIFTKNQDKSLMEKCELLHKEIYG